MLIWIRRFRQQQKQQPEKQQKERQKRQRKKQQEKRKDSRQQQAIIIRLQHRIETIQQAVQQLQATEITQQAAARQAVQVHLLRQSHPIQAAVLQRVERMQTEVQS